MRLENVLALTHGTLLNAPLVSTFNTLVFNASKVTRGDLFVAREIDRIDEAIRNGAYGVMFDRPAQIGDDEVAWIKVDSLSSALKRLLRFALLEKELRVYRCDAVTLKLALQIVTDTNFVVAHGEIDEACAALWNVTPGATLLFSSEMIDDAIFPEHRLLPKTAAEPITIIEQTLFETSFIFDNVFYERQMLSPFFVPYLERLLNFFRSERIEFRLRRFTPIGHFRPVFTNALLEVKEFGTSERVLIFERDLALIATQIDFLRAQANWAKIIVLVPADSAAEFQSAPNLFTYSDKQDIIELLKVRPYHFALIAGEESSVLEAFAPQKEQLTLDFQEYH